MDISTLYNINSDAIRNAAAGTGTRTVETAGDGNGFGNFLNAAVNQLNETNTYMKNQEEEEVKLSLGLTENTHDLAIAQAKASTALQYTVAIRDRFIEAYKELIQIQV